MRTAAFQAATARLALVAMLLLALLPTLGRIAHPQSSGAQAGWAAICTAAGMRYVALPSFAEHAGGEHAQTPDAPQPHGGPDCDYCPLLASLLVVALWLALALPFPLRISVPASHVTPRRSLAHPCGLGSRGPPLAL